MSFEEPNDPRSSEIGNNQIQLTELATYEERTPGVLKGFKCSNKKEKKNDVTMKIQKKKKKYIYVI